MQNYMFLGLKSPYKAIFSLHFAQMALSAFAILAGLVASGSVFLNDLYFWGQSAHYINPYLCLMAFFLAFAPGVWGLAVVICLLPLSAGLGTQLNAYLSTQFLVLPNAGLELVAGFLLGSAVRVGSKVSQLLGNKGPQDAATLLKGLVPWPIALIIVMITISTAIAISRNVYQSAATTSFKGLLFNLVHFRPIDWHDDYMPISDWIAYALAVAMIILVIGQLKDQEHKNQMIFRSIMAGLIVAALMGVSQAITGIGLPENLLGFRKDQLGYAVIGFQPDLHAFAGHMLLGAVGLWGYFYSGISKYEQKLVLLTSALCWTGLILSKSRALFLLALAVMFIWLIRQFWKRKRHIFLPIIAILALIITYFIVLIFNFSNNLSGIPVLSWLGELANEFKSRDLTSWSLFSGIFGSRFEIWEAAIRMWWEFPLMGIGQGNFYRLSDIASFSKSHFLILNHGENAHNYFLQTLTETGLVGVIVFAIALMAPFLGVKYRRILIPSIIAISSLYLGNIFSHSFLVRENLLLVAVFLGLALSFCDVGAGKVLHFNRFCLTSILALAAFFIGGAGGEVVRSFGKFPFTYGSLCFISSPVTPDGWVGGYSEISTPISSLNGSCIKIPKLGENLIMETYCLGSSDVVNLKKGPLKLSYMRSGFVEISQIQCGIVLKCDAVRLLIKTSSCYTPRNLGLNLDGRRLGILIK
jgi:O-antigen ligase